MAGKVMTFWAAAPGVGRRTLVADLAQVWTRKDQRVAIVQTRAQADESWIPTFEFQSIADRRQHWIHPADDCAHFAFTQWPGENRLRTFVRLFAESFDWVLIFSSPEEAPTSLAALDASDLLIWITRRQMPMRLEDARRQVAELNFPVSFLRDVWIGDAPNANQALAVIPMDAEPGVRRRLATGRLAERLESDNALYRRRDKSWADATGENDLVSHLKSQVRPEIQSSLEKQPGSGLRASAAEAQTAQQTVQNILSRDPQLGGTSKERAHLVTRVMEEVLGLGAIESLMKDPTVSEVMVIGCQPVIVERQGKLENTNLRFGNDSDLRTVIDRIVTPLGRRVDESMPLCDARLADGSRVNIVLPPLALDGPSLTIRKFSAKNWTLSDLARMGSMTPEMRAYLETAVRSRKNIVVSGGTGSGKTTLLNALSSVIPDHERIVTIEDAAELRLQKPHVVRLEARPPNAEGKGEIPIRRLVMNALRMRPDRIIVGECRGGEALDMLQAMNTGHDGSLTTLHANNPRDAIGRLETLVLMAGIDLPVRVVREQIRSAVHVIVQQNRMPDGSRRVTSITEITGMEGDVLTLLERFGKGLQS